MAFFKKFLGGGGGRKGFGGFFISTFSGLNDVPHSYAGQANYVLTVNPTETGIAFVIGRGVANGFASLDGTGKVPAAQIPAIAISEFLGVVADQATMLLLTGEYGDWCIRSDLNTVFIITGPDPSVIGGWTQLAYPVDPAKVLADVLDPGAPGYLIDKLASSDGSVLFSIIGTLNHFVDLTVSPFLPHGSVLSIFDNSGGLPVGPSTGEAYIAGATAHGWTKDNIYIYNGATWDEKAATGGHVLHINDIDADYKYLASSGWTDIGTPIAHAASHEVGGADEILPMFYIPVIASYNPISNLPVGPSVGDRYISYGTNLGWTSGNIYEWDGASWIVTVPRKYSSVLVIGNSSGIHSGPGIVGGAVYTWSGTAWQISKYSGTVLLDATDNYGSGFLTEKLWSGDGVVVQTAVPDGRIRLDARIDDVTIALEGTTPKHLAVKDLGITDAKVATANKDGTVATPSMRTLGTGALQAAAGNHAHAVIITLSKTIYNPSGITNTVWIDVAQFTKAHSVLYVRAKMTGGTTATCNARKNGATNHLASDVSAGASWTDGGAITSPDYAAGDYLQVGLTGVTGGPTQVAIEVVLSQST